MNFLKIIQIVKVPYRSYHRPEKSKTSWIKPWWDRYFNPKNPDGSFSHLKAHKLAALVALVNIWGYEMYTQKNKYFAGEKTHADTYWEKYQIDLGFRSTTKDTTENNESGTS